VYMFARVTLLLVLAAAMPAWSQVEPSATGGATPTLDDTQMMTPPPVSGMPYPNFTGTETRSNYLDGSLNVNAAYSDNVAPGIAAQAVSDEIYWILPSVTLSKSTPRQKVTLGYSPSFSFYQHTSVLDTVGQSASFVFQDRLSPHLSISLQDYFLRTSDVFDQSYPFAGGNLTGVAQAPVPALIVPFVEQMSDTANGSIDYQFGRNSMVGGGGSYSTFSFPNPTAAGNLSNSDGEGGSAFYSRRLSGMQYTGLSYVYFRDVITDAQYAPFETQLHTLLPFYTIYFNPKLSLSIAGGVQRVGVAQLYTVQAFSSWSPAGTVSIGWQGNRGYFALSYLHSVIAGEGFNEALYSDSESASGGWKLTRTWNAAFEVSYVNSSPVTQLVNVLYGYEGGDAFTLGASLKHAMGEHFSAACGYDRLQENYPGIPFIARNPVSDRESVTITYEFRKPLGE
jgi:hypothetical protein